MKIHSKKNFIAEKFHSRKNFIAEKFHIKDCPLVYALLPNKTQITYSKFFRLIKSYITKEPQSINIDFEKVVFNAVKIVFKNVYIYGCFFHLAQSFWRKMVKLGLLERFYMSKKFKQDFLMLKSLAYVPESDVSFVYINIQKGRVYRISEKYFFIKL